MILRQATIKYKGYDPDHLKPKSNKRICCSGDSCENPECKNPIRWVNKSQYRNICQPCAMTKIYKNENVRKKMSESSKGKYPSDETKEKIRKSKMGKNNPMYGVHLNGELNGNWKGGFSTIRSYVSFENKCIQLNSRFNNSEMHHITKSIVVYIPKELHRHLYHNIKTAQGMGSINMLALQFINGEL